MGNCQLESYWLACHPDTPQSALAGIQVWPVRKGANAIAIEFRALGNMPGIILPDGNWVPPLRWSRQDHLWQHSCFELFLRPLGEPNYRELNFTTAPAWAAYRFERYRDGMQSDDEVKLLKGYWQKRERRTKVGIVIQLPERLSKLDWEIGLSAVIEETGGTKSYWALAHPPGAPDFHHPTCFAATLPAPDSSCS